MLRSLIDKLTRASLRFKWATIAITILVFVAGVVAFTQFNRELIPSIEFPQTVVLAFNPGDDAESMLENVTIPIEDAVSEIDGIVNVESTTTSGVSAVIISNEFGLDQEEIRQEIQSSIDGLELPDGMDPPQLLTFSLSDMPIISASASSTELNLVELMKFGEEEIIPQLEAIPGVAAVEVTGAQLLPTELPPTPEPTEEPTPEPTPTEEPTPEPTSTLTEEAVEDESLLLPDSWVQAGAAQGLTLETTADLTPEVIEGIASFAPQMLDDLTPEIMLVMPLDALAALPEEFVAGLDSDLQVLLVKRVDFEAAVEELEPVPLPESWIQAAAAQSLTIETTDDLSPELVGGISSFAPELLDDLTPEMLLVMPVDALAALPIDYLAKLDPSLQVLLAIRLVDADVELDPVPLPDSWIQAGAAQGITLETTADLTPEIVTGIAGFAPQMLDELTPLMLLVMPLDTLTALPEEFVAGLDSDVQLLLVKRLEVDAALEEPEPVPLPESWIQAGAAQGLTLETTDDLTPEIVGGIASFAPELLDDLTPEMLLVMPVDALIVLPLDYMAGLDPELQSQLQERIAGAAQPDEPTETEEPQDTGELPAAWQSAGESQGIVLVVPEDVTPEIVQGIANVAPQMLDMLTPEHLRRFSPEVLAWLPADYIAGLDSDLQDELDQLAQPAGGLGYLAVEAASEAESLSEDAPELSGAWRQPPPEGTTGPLPSFETAADLMTSGFADSAAELLNLLVSSGQEQAPQLIADLTPDVIAWLVENEENFLENLSPAVLRLLSPEVLTSLPEEFMASLDPELRAELEGIAAGTVEVFIPTDTIHRVNGNPSLLLNIFKDGEANTVEVSDNVFDKMEELEQNYPGLSFDVVFEQSSFIKESISGVTREGALGALFAVIVILLFLSGTVNGRYRLNWRSTLVAAVSIPLSLMMAFALLRWGPPLVDLLLTPLADATAGIPVLGPTITAIHRLFPIDVTLNIMTLAGMTVAIGRVVDDSIVVLENTYRHIQRGEDQKSSVLVGTRDVSIAIFASTLTTVVVFLPLGLLGGLVGEFFMPFGVAVTYALVSSFFVAVTIVPLLAFLFILKKDLPVEKETTMQRWYTPILKWSLDKRVITLVIAFVLLAGSVFLIRDQPRAFLPDFGEVQITINVKMPNGTTMAATNEKVIEFETKLAKYEECCVIQSEIGTSGDMASRFLGGGGIDQGAASISMGLEESDNLDTLTAEIRQIAESHFGPENVTVLGGSMTSSAFGSFDLVISGDVELLIAFNDQALAALEGVEGLTNVSSNLTEADMILRVDGHPALRFTGELETEDSLGVTEEGKTTLEELTPEGITVSEGFMTKAQTEGFSKAISAILIAIVAVYLVMVVTFRSFIHPFTILFSLPMAMIGVSLALWLTNSVVGISALIGVMMLVGIVVTNAIVLIDRVQVNRMVRGMGIHAALVEGGRTRLRPILMTATATILALLPLALGLTEGALIASELAIVVIGGLATSTLLTLVLVPVMYSLLDRLDIRNRKLEEQVGSSENE
jgi:multidrug efflux pump subunit AcrB